MTSPDINPQLTDSDLSATERRLLNAATTGTLVDLQAGGAEIDDPAQGATWGAERTVRAEVLIELLTGEPTHDGAGRPRAVKLRGARITGPLDLEAARLACPLLLADCRIEEPVNLNEATAPAVRLPGCHLHHQIPNRGGSLNPENPQDRHACYEAQQRSPAGPQVGRLRSLPDSERGNPEAGLARRR